MKSLQKKSIDLYQSFFQKEKPTQAEHNKKMMIVTPILLAFAIVAASGLFTYMRVQLADEHQAVTTYLVDSTSIELYDKAVELQAARSQLQAMHSNLVTYIAAVESYPKVGKPLLELVYNSQPDKMIIESVEYSSDTGMVTITGEAGQIGDPAQYVEKLRQSGKFAEVEYTGYGSSKEQEKQAGITTNSQAVYKFVAMARLLPPGEVQP